MIDRIVHITSAVCTRAKITEDIFTATHYAEGTKYERATIQLRVPEPLAKIVLTLKDFTVGEEGSRMGIQITKAEILGPSDGK